MRVLVFILDNIPFLNATPIVSDRFAASASTGLSSHTPTKKNHCCRNRQGLLCPCDEQLKCHRTFGHSASSCLLRAIRPATISQFSLHYYSNSHSSPARKHSLLALVKRLYSQDLILTRPVHYAACPIHHRPQKYPGSSEGVLVVW